MRSGNGSYLLVDVESTSHTKVHTFVQQSDLKIEHLTIKKPQSIAFAKTQYPLTNFSNSRSFQEKRKH